MVYSWNNYGYSVDANIVGQEFEKIEKKYGEVTRENVLESATPEDSPMHSIFEWDDSVAAHNYRLTQATKLILNLHCEVETPKKEPIKVNAYYNVSENKSGSFINVESAFSNPDTKEIVLKRALDELEAFKAKYKELKELAKIFDAIDELVEKGA